MPSPFPGMDPYLEDPEFFPGLRTSLVFCIAELLQARLPEPYYSDIRLRTWYVPHDEMNEGFVEIRMVEGEQRLVTSIEVLSLSTKTPDSEGRQLYLKSQQKLLAARRDDAIAAAGPFDYHVCTRSFDELQQARVIPIRLQERLPTILIPLLPGDPAVPVSLQLLFDRSYDVGAFQRRSPYRGRSPVPALSAEQSTWAEQLLRERGLLS